MTLISGVTCRLSARFTDEVPQAEEMQLKNKAMANRVGLARRGARL
jgi:hypothetical protein